MKLNTWFIASAFSALLLTGCAETEDKGANLIESGQNAGGINDAATNGINSNPYGTAGSEFGGPNRGYQPGMYGADAAANLGPEFSDPNNPLSKRTIYFMLDNSQVMPDFVPVISAHARYLVANPSQRIILEGHCDERGSREYNIALGEQRAQSVANMLKLQGVSDNQIEIVSYGEEKPAAFGSDEAAWELNRRAVIDYQGR